MLKPLNRRGSILPLLAVGMGFMCLVMVGFLQLGMVRAWRGEAQRVADSSALAGASGFIDGDLWGDSVRARAQFLAGLNTINGQSAIADSIAIYPDSAVVAVRVSYQTPSLLFAPDGIRIAVWSVARVAATDSGDTGGRPVPQGNAYGWWKNDAEKGGGVDSVRVRLIR